MKLEDRTGAPPRATGTVGRDGRVLSRQRETGAVHDRTPRGVGTKLVLDGGRYRRDEPLGDLMSVQVVPGVRHAVDEEREDVLLETELRARLDRQQVEIDAFLAAFAALEDADKLRVLNVARRELTP